MDKKVQNAMLSCVATAAMLASFFNLETPFKARPSPWLRA